MLNRNLSSFYGMDGHDKYVGVNRLFGGLQEEDYENLQSPSLESDNILDNFIKKMVIRNCEFCNVHVADFEVHTCRISGNQHRQSSATLPRSSSVQTHASGQHSSFPNIRKKTDCEETEPAEVSSQYGVANQKPHNPEISDFRFPGKPRGEENQTKSTYLLQPFEDNSAIIDQNPQFCAAWNPNPDVNAPLPVAEPCILPGFQQTFGRRNIAMNRFTQYPNVSSQMQCSGTHHMDEMSSHFVFDCNESDDASINQSSQYYDTSLGIPILAVQNRNMTPFLQLMQLVRSNPIYVEKNFYRQISWNL
ncbi:hypothetical protein CEXT_400841 [Caerostris extrusa]|uniref:Uncharacterized protein n=1 Tax=Caerostris extrusa TaxID=172846 RepID=A0AAV4MTW8_CAEEX|nr:hypothetical protein CEXT_400841 [Caerostris extrusa]